MGRGGYDTTSPSNPRSAMAAQAIRMHEATLAVVEEKAAKQAAANELAKLIRSKQSRGIRDAQRAARQAEEAATAAAADKLAREQRARR
ncbi:hypothetical protein ACN47E_009230 [Coniothyrium glycines]